MVYKWVSERNAQESYGQNVIFWPEVSVSKAVLLGFVMSIVKKNLVCP